MYVDDVYYATLTGGIFDLLDLERVEVLRGPQGTLTGRNAIGGAIKLFSKKPTDENSGMVEAVYGSRNRVDIRGSANFILAQDLYARISGVYKRQNGYVDQLDYGCANPGNPQGISARPGSGSDCVIDKLGEKGYAGVRGSVRYNPGDNFDLVIIGDYTHEERTNAAEVISLINPARITNAYACGRFCTYANFYAPAGGFVSQGYEMPNRLKFDGYGFSANMTVGLSDSINIQSITRDCRSGLQRPQVLVLQRRTAHQRQAGRHDRPDRRRVLFRPAFGLLHAPGHPLHRAGPELPVPRQ
jgi:iron complex outermembrane receptor protein